MNIGDVAIFKLGIGIKSGIIVKINDRTFYAKLKDGSIVKRHFDKHFISGHSDVKVNPNSQLSDS